LRIVRSGPIGVTAGNTFNTHWQTCSAGVYRSGTLKHAV
jgi:hypothetical protein